MEKYFYDLNMSIILAKKYYFKNSVNDKIVLDMKKKICNIIIAVDKP